MSSSLFSIEFIWMGRPPPPRNLYVRMCYDHHHLCVGFALLQLCDGLNCKSSRAAERQQARPFLLLSYFFSLHSICFEYYIDGWSDSANNIRIIMWNINPRFPCSRRWSRCLFVFITLPKNKICDDEKILVSHSCRFNGKLHRASGKREYEQNQ